VKSPYLVFGDRTYVMGIINVTPDSFSGDGLLGNPDVIQAAIDQAKRFVAAGADILDIGGESTRPGSQPVDSIEERGRVLPVIHALAHQNLDVILSIDTYKSEVAADAIKVGANWINDVWGLRADPKLAEVAARFKKPIILMHNRSRPSSAELQERLGGRYVSMEYNNLIEDITTELLLSVEIAVSAGVAHENIILDPGIGFGKTVEQNLQLLNQLNAFKRLGFPILLGPSRKSFIGYTLNLPPEERLEGTLAACAIGIQRGADILRVHDVEAVVRFARMMDAVLHSN